MTRSSSGNSRRCSTPGVPFHADEYRLDLDRFGLGVEAAFFKFSCQPLLDAAGNVAENHGRGSRRHGAGFGADRVTCSLLS